MLRLPVGAQRSRSGQGPHWLGVKRALRVDKRLFAHAALEVTSDLGLGVSSSPGDGGSNVGRRLRAARS
jgi:hypothetical protein